jgi:hypothetical protein
MVSSFHHPFPAPQRSGRVAALAKHLATKPKGEVSTVEAPEVQPGADLLCNAPGRADAGRVG